VAGPAARGAKQLRSYLALIPNRGFAPRPRNVPADRSRVAVTPDNAVPVKLEVAADRAISMVCGLSPQESAPIAANPFAPPPEAAGFTPVG
jgi:hypothetical protein